MYSEDEGRFEEIGELMVGMGLVEMVDYDKVGELLLKGCDVMERDIGGNNELSVDGIIDVGSWGECGLKLWLEGEKESVEEYYKVLDCLKKEEYIKRNDYIGVRYVMEKLIGDEEYEICVLKKGVKE